VSEEGTWLGVPTWHQDGQDSIPCKLSEIMPGVGVLTLPVDIVTYNIDGLMEAADAFLDVINQHQVFAQALCCGSNMRRKSSALYMQSPGVRLS
jgi:NAD-dependent SIR2 family protein deacetylase